MARNEKGGGNTVTRKDGKSRLDQLEYVAEQWATPRASDNENRNTHSAPSHGVTRGETLAGQAGVWATPIANDAEKRGRIAPEKNVSLSGQTQTFHSHHPAQMTTLDGKKSLNMRAVLNPLFVEWLMGLPGGWTDYECAETGFIHWLAHMRGALDRNCSQNTGVNK